MTHLRTRETTLVAVLAALYLALGAAYGAISPPFESPDEVGHFFAVKYIADHGQLPSPDREPAQQYLYGQEGTQPPLYYLLGALILRLSGVPTDDAQGYLRVNPHTTCGSPILAGNKAFLAHDPAQERFPWRGSILALHMLRLYSTTMGLLAVLGVYCLARLCFPDWQGAAVLAAAVTAFNPQFLFVSAGVNNDSLLAALCTWSLFLILRSFSRPHTSLSSALTGLLVGLAALTKVGGLLLLPLAGVAIPLAVSLSHSDCPTGRPRALLRYVVCHWRPIVGHCCLVMLPALAVAGWWYLRNALLYADAMLIEHHLAIVSQRAPVTPAHVLREVPSMFTSYWGRFTCDIAPGKWYNALWGLVTLAGAGGLVLGWRRLSLNRRVALSLVLLWFGLVFAGWLRWNLAASGVQGRLLFPAVASVSLLVGGGIARLTGRNGWLRFLFLLVWLGLALGMLFGLIRPTFTPPLRYPSPDGLDIPNRMNAVFDSGGARLELLGYEVQPGDLEPGETVEVTLYLSTQQPITDTFSLGLWLVSAIPGDTTRLVGLDTWPGNGNYPTHIWKPGGVLVDSYRLTVPADVQHVQAWMVHLNVLRVGGNGWLPFSQDGQTVGDRATLGRVRVAASEPEVIPTKARLEAVPVFGGTIALRGAQIVPAGSRASVHLTLWWEAMAVPQADYTVFVHMVDKAGRSVGSGDGPPLLGGFPTSLWCPGDSVADEHIIQLPADLRAGDYILRVGWYDPVTGTRLPLVEGDYFEIPEAVHIE